MSKITPATLMLGIFAVIFGLIGAYAVRRYMAQSEEVALPAPPPQAPPQLSVPIASTDLESGRALHLYDVAVLRMTQEEFREAVKEGRYPSQVMTNTQQIFERMLKEPLKKGEAFTTDMFYPEGQGPTIAEKLQPGLRAVNIQVEGTGVLSGFDGPGSMVDVLFRADAIEDGDVPETTVTLLEGVEVLAMETNAAARGNVSQERTTLAVTAEQANALKIAEGRGSFSLLLRNPGDMQVAGVTQPQTLARLLNLSVSEEFTTDIYRRGAVNTTSFPGRTYVPQPTTQLPLVGLLNGRGRQQPASIEKRDEVTPVEISPPRPFMQPATTPQAPNADPARPPKAASPSVGSAPSGTTKSQDDLTRSDLFGRSDDTLGSRSDLPRSVLDTREN